MCKELKKLVLLCRKNGVQVTQGRKHLRFHTPEGFYFAACTPSDRRALRHVRAALRRMGCKLMSQSMKEVNNDE